MVEEAVVMVKENLIAMAVMVVELARVEELLQFQEVLEEEVEEEVVVVVEVEVEVEAVEKVVEVMSLSFFSKSLIIVIYSRKG